LVLENGLSRISITLADRATLDDLLSFLLAQYPASALGAAVAVVNGELVSHSTPLSDGQDVALLLPIAGG
jgi:molybdopterin converting factor small subunit